MKRQFTAVSSGTHLDRACHSCAVCSTCCPNYGPRIYARTTPNEAPQESGVCAREARGGSLGERGDAANRVLGSDAGAALLEKLAAYRDTLGRGATFPRAPEVRDAIDSVEAAFRAIDAALVTLFADPNPVLVRKHRVTAKAEDAKNLTLLNALATVIAKHRSSDASQLVGRVTETFRKHVLALGVIEERVAQCCAVIGEAALPATERAKPANIRRAPTPAECIKVALTPRELAKILMSRLGARPRNAEHLAASARELGAKMNAGDFDDAAFDAEWALEGNAKITGLDPFDRAKTTLSVRELETLSLGVTHSSRSAREPASARGGRKVPRAR